MFQSIFCNRQFHNHSYYIDGTEAENMFLYKQEQFETKKRKKRDAHIRASCIHSLMNIQSVPV